jgi:hypothetical protein
MKRTMQKELFETIENCTDGNGVRCLLESIYGEDKGNKLFKVWTAGDKARLRMLMVLWCDNKRLMGV